MDLFTPFAKDKFDRINAILAAFVLFFTFIIYRMTVAPTLSFWDCGEFIASAYILGIPHPPGSPLFVVLGRLFSTLPIASDICFRVNMLSVIASAFTAMFGYLSLVRIIRYWYNGDEIIGWKRVISYIGGIVGAFFLAFSATNWSNSVEAEVYGLSMMLTLIIFWLMLVFFESRGTPRAERIIVLVCYLAMLGVAVHLTTFLILPVAAIFFILRKDAPPRAWVAICGFFVAELLAIIMLSNRSGGYQTFLFLSVLILLGTAFFVYKHINWPVLIGIGAFSMIMVGFYWFLAGIIGGALVVLLLAFLARESDWKTALVVLLLAVMGFSFHIFIPVRSAQQPRINENNPSRDFATFVNYLDRKQYGQTSMVERMFQRRGTWENQFGHHANMGFWSYFEEQYANPKIFLILFLIGLYGVGLTIRRKLEIGLPFLTLLLLASVGLVLYMNFADGTKYNEVTGDAYLEVRNRDYFFTPAFIFFGMALGLGAAAIMEFIRKKTEDKFASLQKPAMIAASLLVFLPSLALADNYFTNDRSRNYYPYIYAYNILQSCKPDAILFTSGDNDTFPLWCLQEVYEVRKDVRVVNLSLFNTDWYVWQMKSQYGVPISLTEDQIIWHPFTFEGRELQRPKESFFDRARKRRTYLVPMPFEGRIVKLQDMMVDEVVLTNNWKYPVCFTSEPYAESPLRLRDLAVATGVISELASSPPEKKINTERGYELFTQVYRYDGLNDPTIYRDENESGVMLTLGFNALRLADDFRRSGQNARANEILHFIIEKYPEFFQAYMSLSDFYRKDGDTAKADSIMADMESTLADLHRHNPSSLFYMQDLGLAKYYRGDTDGGLALLWQSFNANPNSSYAYRKLIQVLFDTRRTSDILRATQMHAEYKMNRNDPLVQQIMGQSELLRQQP